MNIILHFKSSQWFGGQTDKVITSDQIGTTVTMKVFLKYFKLKRVERRIHITAVDEKNNELHGTIVKEEKNELPSNTTIEQPLKQ